jgi:hypothetical protein
MRVPQEMTQQQINGKKYDYLQIKFHIYEPTIIDGLLDLLDHVDLILKYFIGCENPNILLSEAM